MYIYTFPPLFGYNKSIQKSKFIDMRQMILTSVEHICEKRLPERERGSFYHNEVKNLHVNIL